MAVLSGAGRRGIQIRRIRSVNARQVMFSKCRSGLLKKASELCTLCAVEAAFVIFSTGGKAFSFGHPSVGTVANQVVNFGKPVSDSSQNALNDDEANLHELDKRYSNEELRKMRMEHQKRGGLMIRTVDELSLEELVKLKSMLNVVHEKLLKRLQRLSVDVASPTPTFSGCRDAPIGDLEKDSSANSYGHCIGSKD